MKTEHWGILSAAALATLGCGASHAGHGVEFPSQASVQELAASPVGPSNDEARKTATVDDWQPTQGDAPSTAAEALAQRAAASAGHPVRLEAELACTAREVARFYAEHGAFPDQQLQAYMAGVCGATEAQVVATVWSTPSDTVADASREKQWHDGIAKQLADWLPPATKQLGAAELAEGNARVFAATIGRSDINWDAHSTLADADGKVELSGSLGTPAAFVFGLVNVGDSGATDCISNPRVAAPRFDITCQLAPGDDSAWVDLEALPPGRVLTQGIARVLIRREGTALGFTAATKELAPERVSDAHQLRQRLLALINQRRAAAQLPVLRLVQRESETSARLAAHFFQGGTDTELGDQIALGLMAGWDVQGATIRSGNFFSDELSGSLDPRRWLGFVLEQPSARRVLLDPEARAIAIGPDVQPKSETVGALISTYSFYTSEDHRADIQRFLTHLNRRRNGLGLSPVKVTPEPEVLKAVRSVETSHDPDAALQIALQQLAAQTRRSVQGFYIEATEVDHVKLPPALLQPNVTIAIAAAHHRYPQAAWGTLTLLVIVMDSTPGGPRQTASHAGHRRG